jgi:hypothetical protein
MKRYIVSVVPVLALLGILIASSASAQTKDHHGCSTVTTAGNWAFTDSGSVVGLGPFGAIGTFTLDAAGNVIGEQTNSVNGSVSRLTFSGPYTVNSDCTGSTNLDVFDSLGNKVRTSGLDLVFDDDIQEMRAIFTSVVLPNGVNLPAVITLEARRLFSKDGPEN